MTVSQSEQDVEFIGVDTESATTAAMDGFSLDLKKGMVTDTHRIPPNVSFSEAAEKHQVKRKRSHKK